MSPSPIFNVELSARVGEQQHPVHLESSTVVCTGTYRYVPVRTMLWYEKQVKSMYQYVLVHTFLRIFQKVYTGTY